MAVFDKLDPEMVPNMKLGAHSFQIIFVFIIWCLEIVVFKDGDSEINGNNGWTFAVCFLSIPAWIYLIMTPRWERSRKFAEVHAMLTIDAVFAVFWLSAFATQAKYNSDNDCGGVCGLSKGIVGLGVFVFLFWVGSTFLSAYTLHYWNFHSMLPGYEKRQLSGAPINNDPDKMAFSMAPDGEETYARVDMHDPESGGRYGGSNPYNDHDHDNDHAGGSRYEGPDSFGSYGSRHDQAYDGGARYSSPGRPDPGYSSQGPSPAFPPAGAGAYDDGPARFPDANYGA